MKFKLNVKETLKTWVNAASKYSPEILTGLGTSGLILGTVLAVKATPKAQVLIEEKKVEKAKDELTQLETVQAAWTAYIPTVVVDTVSLVCIFGASTVNFRRNAALSAAYSLLETSSREFQEKVVETVGEKKAEEIQDAVAKDQLKKSRSGNQKVIVTQHGTTPCVEPISGNCFYTDIEHVRKCFNILNKDVQRVGYTSLNDLFYNLGLPEIGIPNCDIGNELGWGERDGLVDVRFSAQLDENETPCLVMVYSVAPHYGYRD